MRQLWDFPGGVHPPEHKTQSLQLPLAELPLPPTLILPLSQHAGAGAEPIVQVGDRVLTGQLIGAGRESISANVHASTSGEVVAIESRPVPHPSGLDDLCIIIEPDGKDDWVELHPCKDFHGLDRSQVLEKIQSAGIVGMGGAGFPTAIKLSVQFDVDTLIINGTECEPYITADDILMQNFAAEIVQGIQLADYLLEHPQQVFIAIEENKPQAIAAMEAAVATLNEPRISVVPLPVKYPSGGEKQLVQMLTGREVPSGKLPVQVGAVCQNIATVLAAYRAIHLGEPLISRVTTITGNAFATQRNVQVRLGTPVHFILEQHGFNSEQATRLVMGGPMMGFTLLDPLVPAIKTTNCLLAPTREESPPPPPAQACIRCGLCAEACPASLLPQQLYWYARAEDEEKLQAYNLFDCIECGACSYVCPSHIPLVQYYRAAKGEIRQHAIEKAHADRARQRFEFHKQRIEAEKAARAKAREEAAAKAKERAKHKPAAKKPPPASAEPAPSADKPAVAAPVKPNLDPAAERARLERNLTSAEDRLQKLHSKLDELKQTAPDQAEATRARIKEAELKRRKLQDKLAALSEPTTADQSQVVAAPTPRPQSTAALAAQLNEVEKQLTELADKQSDKAAALSLSANILREKLRHAEAINGD